MRISDAVGQIDWTAPWMASYCAHGQPLADGIASGASISSELNRALCAPGEPAVTGERGLPHRPARPSQPNVRFIADADWPSALGYERFIFDTGCIPTRDNLHDFFNGLCWLTFPATKRQLNRLQAHELSTSRAGAARGAVRDAITVFDENGALLDAPAPLWDALEARDWERVFVTLRPLWAEARLVLFGHALLEKLVHPRKTMVAHVYRGQLALDSIANADHVLADALCATVLATKPFFPLPVLGVPGWWAANQNFCFYDDSDAFRAPRSRGARGSDAGAPRIDPA